LEIFDCFGQGFLRTIAKVIALRMLADQKDEFNAGHLRQYPGMQLAARIPGAGACRQYGLSRDNKTPWELMQLDEDHKKSPFSGCTTCANYHHSCRPTVFLNGGLFVPVPVQ
jgi:hypothetical protein